MVVFQHVLVCLGSVCYILLVWTTPISQAFELLLSLVSEMWFFLDYLNPKKMASFISKHMLRIESKNSADVIPDLTSNNITAKSPQEKANMLNSFFKVIYCG